LAINGLRNNVVRFDEVGVANPRVVQVVTDARNHHRQLVQRTHRFRNEAVLGEYPEAHVGDIESVCHVVEWCKVICLTHFNKELLQRFFVDV
jgi:hypothetical protein